MNQRRRILLAGAAALAAPFGSFAQQQGKVWREGFLSPRFRPASLDTHSYGAFVQGMRESGQQAAGSRRQVGADTVGRATPRLLMHRFREIV